VGNYTVTLTVPGCPAFTTTATVTITSAPAATIAYAGSAFCSGAAIQNVTQTGNTGGVYSSGSGLSLNTSTGSIDPALSTSGNYTVTYTLASSGGCAAYTANAQVSISQTITASFSHSICQGETYTFGSYTASSAGSYADTTVTTAGCDSISILTLSVNSLPNSTVNADTSIFCPGDSTQICAPSGLTSYIWNTGATGSCISASNAGNYYVTVTDANNCSAESNHVAVSVHPLPSVSVSVNGDTLSAYNALSYQWYVNGNQITGAQSNTYIASATGSYQVQVTDSNGCKALSNSIQVTITGIGEIVAEDFKVFPNPIETGKWNMECGSDLIGNTLEIFDASGRIVFKEEITSRKSEINFIASKGVYYLRIHSLTKTVIEKLVHL